MLVISWEVNRLIVDTSLFLGIRVLWKKPSIAPTQPFITPPELFDSNPFLTFSHSVTVVGNLICYWSQFNRASMNLFLLLYASVVLTPIHLRSLGSYHRPTISNQSQQRVPRKLVAYCLSYIWRVSMLAWAIRLSHWMQSHSYEILYETCLDG